MPVPVPFTERSRSAQIVLAAVVPFVFGAVVGVFLGISAGAYWGLSALAAIGAVLAGLEHPDARSGVGLPAAHCSASASSSPTPSPAPRPRSRWAAFHRP